jgi:hypothetical protein
MTDIRKVGPALARRNSEGGTAQHAARTTKGPTIRQRVLDSVTAEPGTGEMILQRLLAAGVRTVLYSVKPRLSELSRVGLVCDSGKRGRSDGGKTSIIYRATTEAERAAWRAAHDEAGGA